MTDAASAKLLQSARSWVDADPDGETARQMSDWIEPLNESALRDCFEPPLQFGTAGIRGVVGPGPARMNLAVVRRVTRALAEHLEQTRGPGSKVVVGCDARLDSPRFTAETAAVLAAAGCDVLKFDGPVATPVVAYACLKEQAAAGIVVTASHNPPQYNGYKVYGDRGIQIVSPVDLQIAARIEQLPAANAIAANFDDSRHSRPLGSKCLLDYHHSVLQSRPKPTQYPLRIAYTPLHGVGWHPIRELFRLAGHGDVQPVPSQVKPDGRFPTVNFPNPEEPSTLDLGMRLAEAIRADILLANDPDADRLAMALPDEKGRWHALTGNQLGIVLMDYMLEQARQSPTSGRALCVSTIVSTPMADAVAAAYGARFERTLTGFKWLWTAALELLSNEPLQFAIAWEEALGYSTHSDVRDKDGIAAALIGADWAAACNASGELPWNRLGRLYRNHGVWASRQINALRPGGTMALREAFERLANNPPKEIDGHRIVDVEDYRKGGENRPLWRRYSELIILSLAGGPRLLVRPSGTEPKLKLYVDVPAEVSAKEDPFSVVHDAEERAERLGRRLLGWLEL